MGIIVYMYYLYIDDINIHEKIDLGDSHFRRHKNFRMNELLETKRDCMQQEWIWMCNSKSCSTGAIAFYMHVWALKSFRRWVTNLYLKADIL